MFRLLLIAALPLLTGCTSIDLKNIPADWPELRIEIHEVSTKEIFANCWKYTAFLSLPLACAEVRFHTKTCVIYVTAEADPSVLDHEIDHCRGADHHGESVLRDAWAAWKAS